MGQNVIAVVLAGGYGTISSGLSKVVESVSPVKHLPMVRAPLELFRQIGVTSCYLVVNDRFLSQISEAVSDLSPELVVQNRRVGNGGAVKLCLPKINEHPANRSADTVVVLYGDMPLWKPQSIQALIASHQRANAVVSMFSIQVSFDCPASVAKFGRILRDRNGRIIAVREPYELSEDEAKLALTVNPSAWVYNRAWLEDSIAALKPHDRGDSYPVEYWLPDLVCLAAEQDLPVNELPLSEAWQALGVNTRAELEEVQGIWRKEFERAS